VRDDPTWAWGIISEVEDEIQDLVLLGFCKELVRLMLNRAEELAQAERLEVPA
jgi:hypothetical protein